MNLNLLFVDDDDDLRTNLIKIFDGREISGHRISASGASTFQEGKKLVSINDYDIIVLDLYEGKPEEGKEKLGIDVLKEIQSLAFIPVIFYSGLTKDLTDMESEIVGVVNKGGGVKQLSDELSRIIRSNIALIKRKINDHIRVTLRDYFWKTVHEHKSVIEPIKNDVSIGYLLLRHLAHSLSKENIKSLLGDVKIREGRAHPMEFYIYPTNTKEEFEAGEILLKNDAFYTILTPSCDFIAEDSRKRKVGSVLLSIGIPLEKTEQFSRFQSNPGKHEDDLLRLIESRKGDRFFFLPGTPFIKNIVLDFQYTTMVNYEELNTFQRIAKLDTPFAQSMVTSFIRYYNRIGYPDIDAKYVVERLKPEK